MGFHVGQKVVCVGVFKNRDYPVPTKGDVYTVAAVTMGATKNGLCLHEFPNHRNTLGWAVNAFRPLHERKTDISIFTQMLTPKKIGVDA